MKSVSKKKKKNNFKIVSFGCFNKLSKSLKIVIVAIIIGVQLALLLSYFYSFYKNRLFAEESIRDTLTYQGKVTNSDGVPPPDGQYNMRFRIYDQASGGNLLWTETWDGTSQGIAGSKVTVSEGVFTAELNSLCGNWVGDCATNGGVTFRTDSFYLQVELDYNSDGSYEEIFTPRKRFTATPYAMNADKFDGYDSTDFVLKAGDSMTGNLNLPLLNAEKIIDSSLIAYYKFDNNANDSSANGYDGFLEGGAATDNNILNLAGTTGENFDINAIDDYINTDTGTVSFWLRRIFSDDTTGDKIAVNLNTDVNNNIKISYLYSSDQWAFDYIAGGTSKQILISPNLIPENSWTRLSMSWDTEADEFKVYINGEQTGSTITGLGTWSGAVTSSVIGADALTLNSNFMGYFDDFKLYSRALTDDEISMTYESQSRNQIHSNNLTIDQINFEYVDQNVNEGGNLYWDNVYNRFKFTEKLFAPDSMPTSENENQNIDYSYRSDLNKILAYNFFESKGSTVSDLAGNADGTMVDDADWTNLGYFGYGMEFDDDGDSVTFSNPGLSSTEGSLEMWVRLNNITDSNTNYILRMYAGDSNEIAIYKENLADLYIELGDSTAIDTTWDFPDTSWHHIALIWQLNSYEVFVDAESVATGDFYNLDTTTFTGFYLGSKGLANTSLNGVLDNFAIYNDLLSDQEIKNHYHSAFNNLYVENIISDGNTSSSLQNLINLPATQTNNNLIDPVYFNNNNQTLSFAFSEGQGNATSSKAGSLSANIYGANWVKDGYYGAGMHFDGLDDYLSIADADDYGGELDMGSNNFSIEFWVKGYDDGQSGADNANTVILSKKDTNSGYQIMFDANDKIIFFLGDGINTYTANSTAWDLSDNKWHHVLFTVDRSNNTATLIRDGFAINSFDISSITGSLDSSADFYMGKDSSGNFLNGTLDSVILYKDKLLNIYDEYGRITNSPESLIINSSNVATDSAALGVINQTSNGYSAIIASINDTNSQSPLFLGNSAQTNDVYKFLTLGTINNFSLSVFGNLSWDNANNKFIFDNNLQVEGDLESNYLQTESNEAIAFDVIRHTITSSDVSLRSFNEAWDKATTRKIVDIESVCMHEADTNDKVTSDDWTNSPACDNSESYDGTNITVFDQMSAWTENDIVTIFVTYEK